MTDMIERVARAICVDLGRNPDAEHYHGMSDTISRGWEQFDSTARAAIAAWNRRSGPVSGGKPE